jgi:hypothetical protein
MDVILTVTVFESRRSVKGYAVRTEDCAGLYLTWSHSTLHSMTVYRA